MALVNEGYLHHTEILLNFSSLNLGKKKSNWLLSLKNSGEQSRAIMAVLFCLHSSIYKYMYESISTKLGQNVCP